MVYKKFSWKGYFKEIGNYFLNEMKLIFNERFVGLFIKRYIIDRGNKGYYLRIFFFYVILGIRNVVVNKLFKEVELESKFWF